jgi:hypothetical protein
VICPLCDTELRVVRTINGDQFPPHGDCPGGFAYVTEAETKLESRYTPANDWCRHPERWHSDDWDSAEHEVSALIGALVTALRPDIVVETGAAFGQTSYHIGSVLAEAGVGTLHAVEIDPHRCEIIRKRCEGLPVVVEQCSSMDYMPPDGVGFAWLDSVLPLRIAEFQRYHPTFAPGALVGFHDTAPHHGAKLWDDILVLEGELLMPIRLRTPRGVVIAEVIGS